MDKFESETKDGDDQTVPLNFDDSDSMSPHQEIREKIRKDQEIAAQHQFGLVDYKIKSK